MNCVLRVTDSDNVATAIRDIAKGEHINESLVAAEPINFGFKVALSDIRCGALITKYGITIAQSTTFITAGSCVHIHNAKSLCDLRSADFDIITDAPTDMSYTLLEDSHDFTQQTL